MRKIGNKVLIIGLSLLPTFIYSSYNLTVTASNAALNASAKAELEGEINKQFQGTNLPDYMGQMSNAQAITNKGQGVSYASDHSLFVIGGSGGLGLNTTSGFSFSSSGGLPAIGVGAQASVMAGLSLSRFPLPQIGPIDLKKITVFINFFSYSDDSLVTGLTMKMNTFGIHAQYKFMDGKNIGGIGVLNWGGLAFTTGFDVSSNSFNYKIGQKISTTTSGVTFDWTPSSGSSLSLESKSFSIPLEISTSVRLLYVLSIFAGTGIDLNFGNSTIAANLNGPITTSAIGQVGTATLTASEEKGPGFGTWRFFAGPQLNLVPLKNTNLLSLYAQGNYSIGGNYGAHAGVRIAW